MDNLHYSRNQKYQYLDLKIACIRVLSAIPALLLKKKKKILNSSAGRKLTERKATNIHIGTYHSYCKKLQKDICLSLYKASIHYPQFFKRKMERKHVNYGLQEQLCFIQKQVSYAYTKCCKDDSSYFLFDRFLKNIRQDWNNIVSTQIFTHLRTECQQPHTENHLILKLKATFITQDSHDTEKISTYECMLFLKMAKYPVRKKKILQV